MYKSNPFQLFDWSNSLVTEYKLIRLHIWYGKSYFWSEKAERALFTNINNK